MGHSATKSIWDESCSYSFKIFFWNHQTKIIFLIKELKLMLAAYVYKTNLVPHPHSYFSVYEVDFPMLCNTHF